MSLMLLHHGLAWASCTKQCHWLALPVGQTEEQHAATSSTLGQQS
jgi:hypothetical protein